MSVRKKIAFKIFYDGKNFSGLVLQPGKRTVYSEFLRALGLFNLIDKSMEKNNIECAGRTDSGVSAVAMVLSIFINEYSVHVEYDSMLNSVLPEDLRVIQWAYVPDDFSARYNCILREYKYFFKYDGSLPELQEKLELLRKNRNFKFLCKRTKEKELKKINEIMDEKFYIRQLEYLRLGISEDFYVMEIGARSFMHNMVRKIHYFLVNGKIKKPYILKNPSDISEIITTPEYKHLNLGTSDPDPLLFYSASFNISIPWKSNNITQKKLSELSTKKRIEFLKYKFIP